MTNLKYDFFTRPPELVAKELLGKYVIRRKGKKVKIGKIVETEAYLARHDTACHASNGETPRNAVMFGPAGHAYLYFTYGLHWMFNIVTEKEDLPSAVLIRALEPISPEDDLRIAAGPAKLCKWLEIGKAENTLDLSKSKELFVTDRIRIENHNYLSPTLEESDIFITTRIGVNYAGSDAALPLRFYIKNNPSVSKPDSKLG